MRLLDTTKSFNQTYTNSIGFKKIEINYATNIDNIADDAYQGSGTSNDPYIISSTSDLDLLAKLVNDGNDFSGKFFQQNGNITYTHATYWNDPNSTENNYTAIGYYNNINDQSSFQGTYDGGGHTISGIRIYRNINIDSDKYQGIFGRVFGTIKRVNLADTRITGGADTGGIAGSLSDGSVEDCTVGSDVCIHQIYSVGNHGGIVGFNNGGTICRCISRASLTVKSGVSTSGYGGIVGYTYGGNITDCIAYGVTIPNVYAGRGAIIGVLYNDCTLTRNYYYNCKVASNVVTPSGVGQGTARSTATNDVDGAQALYAITLGANITLTRSAEATLPGTNNKTYANGADINGQPYAYAGAAVSLDYSGSVPEGYQMVYSVTINGSDPAETVAVTDDTFTMPDGDVTVATKFLLDGVLINEANFPDENFRNWLLAKGYGSDGVLTDDEIAGIELISVAQKGIADLTGIEHFTALTILYCKGNRLTSLDVSQNIALESLDCDDNQLTALNVSHNTALTYLDCSNNQLTVLDVSHNTALVEFYCYNNQFNGERMEALVTSLPTVDVENNGGRNGQFYVVALNDEMEQNVITTTQVATARGKNWRVLGWTNGSWEEYDGSEPATFEPGDVNGDGNVVVQDVSTTIDYILGNPTETFYDQPADVNHDGNIDVQDVSAIIDIILNK